MRNPLFPAASALALICFAGPFAVSAQTATTAVVTPVLTAAQQTDYNSWTAEQRAAYDAWPATYQVYYWTLTPAQMTGWWRLSDVQRGQIVAMTPEQQAAAWSAVEAQLTGQPAAAAPAGGVVQANPVGSAAPP